MDKIIFLDDPEAAKFVEGLSGWVSRDGNFYGKNSAAAKWAGATHVKCEHCLQPVPKGRILCFDCREKVQAARYEQREKVEWDQSGALYSETADRYFFDLDEVADYAYNHDLKMADLRLVICEPVYLTPVDEDNWADDLPEDADGLPDEVVSALADLNDILKAAGPVSWQPGHKAVIL